MGTLILQVVHCGIHLRLSAQLRGSLPGRSVVLPMGSSKASVGLSGTSTQFFPSPRPSPVENKSIEYSVLDWTGLDCFGLLGLICAVLMSGMKVSL